MARNGKIARLPKSYRDVVNRKLQDGESGVAIVAWLKTLWDTNSAVAEAVGEEPVNEQNLSVWRQGGYLDWERRQAATDLVLDLTEHAQDLKTGADGRDVSDRLSTVLLGELARTAEALLTETTAPRERWAVLKDLLRELTRVRQADHRAAKLAREHADWQARQPRPVELDAQTEISEQVRKTRMAAAYAGSLHMKGGRSEGNWEMAVAEAEIEFGLPPGTLKVGQASRLPSPDAGQATGEPAAGHDVRNVPGSLPSPDVGQASRLPSPASGEESESPANEAESSKIKENQGEADAGEKTEDPPSSDYGAASLEKTEEEDDYEDDKEAVDEAAVPASTGFETGMGQQYAEDGTPLPPGVRWKFVCNPYFSGPSRKMFLVNTAGEEVTQDGRPIAAAAAESGKIKENQGWSEAPPELPPGMHPTTPKLPAKVRPDPAEATQETTEHRTPNIEI